VPGTIYFGTEKFIDAMGLKLVAGRNFGAGTVLPPATDFGAALGAWAPEMIVTQAMAKKLFPKGDALGQTVYAGLINKSAVVVGIVDLMRANPVPAQSDQFATQVVIVPITPPGPHGVYVVRAKPGRRDPLMAELDKDFAKQRHAHQATAAVLPRWWCAATVDRRGARGAGASTPGCVHLARRRDAHGLK
jgi:putative ABC transport system permease protein